jgi:hypothetical protein
LTLGIASVAAVKQVFEGMVAVYGNGHFDGIAAKNISQTLSYQSILQVRKYNLLGCVALPIFY